MFKTLLIQESWLLFAILSVLYFLVACSKPDKTHAHFGYLFVILVLGIFYRTKDDPIVLDDTHFLAPCGGKIKKIENDGTRTKIRVFLNIHDQHAQFYPVSGTVTDVAHKLGKFNPAYILEKT